MVRRFTFALAALALLGVSACEKPAPQITISSGGKVINVDASRYCFDECRDHSAKLKTIRVKSNSTVTFDVPRRVAHAGWLVQLRDQAIFPEPRKDSHYTLSIPAAAAVSLPVTVVEAGADGAPTGVWKLQFDIKD